MTAGDLKLKTDKYERDGDSTGQSNIDSAKSQDSGQRIFESGTQDNNTGA